MRKCRLPKLLPGRNESTHLILDEMTAIVVLNTATPKDKNTKLKTWWSPQQVKSSLVKYSLYFLRGNLASIFKPQLILVNHNCIFCQILQKVSPYKPPLTQWCVSVHMHCYRQWFISCHDDVIKWKHLPRYWPFVREIHGNRWFRLAETSDV